MKKTIYTLGIITALTSMNVAQTKNIAFEHGTFKEIKEKALKENKLIFVDAYTTWCGPCKQMAKNVFTNDTVADYYNANFVNAKIDMEKGEGPEIAKQYEVQCYPNLLFIDGNGNLVHRIAGSMSASDFISLAKTAANPDERFAHFAANLEANKTNSEFLKKYIDARENTCLSSDDLVKTYFALQKEEELSNQQNWEMIQAHTNKIDAKEFTYLLANKSKFETAYTADAVNEKIENVLKSSLNAVIRTKPFDEKKYNDTKANITSLNQANTKLIFFEADMNLAKKKADWAGFSKIASDNVDLYYLADAEKLNSIAWDFYENVSDKAGLLKAETWAKKASELENSYAVLDTYASLLYKNGKKDEALKTANKAIETAKAEKYTADDYKGTVDLLKKIKELK
jgi:thioredoxin-related protein